MPRIEVIQGDITRLAVDAIVNAANSSLLGGGGVDGAIHRAAGPDLLEQCIQIRNRDGGCKTGDAKVTGAGRLKAKWVIHAVGPVWNGGKKDEPELLASCYRKALALAAELGATTIAFPAISTGIYGFPLVRACEIAIATIKAHTAPNPEHVVLCMFGPRDLDVMNKVIAGEAATDEDDIDDPDDLDALDDPAFLRAEDSPVAPDDVDEPDFLRESEDLRASAALDEPGAFDEPGDLDEPRAFDESSVIDEPTVDEQEVATRPVDVQLRLFPDEVNGQLELDIARVVPAPDIAADPDDDDEEP